MHDVDLLSLWMCANMIGRMMQRTMPTVDTPGNSSAIKKKMRSNKSQSIRRNERATHIARC